ncbi:MAG: Tm-1-like ATP-binding domain-containing protein [Deltaproteobacteria bacterium]|nr:Tm-1-like ATP-binding domain-containing protein [Deltaproteobacteria bacterium]
MTKKIVVVGTLDTKEMEIRFVKELIEGKGHAPVVIDCGLLKEPSLVPDISRHQIAQAAGTTIEAILQTGDKNHAIGTMTRGVVQVTQNLHAKGELDGILSLGGVQGTVIGTTVMQALPFGVPKVMISAVANGQATFGPFVGIRDVTILHSVADVLGLNDVTRRVLAEGAGAVVGMVEMDYSASGTSKPAVALTSAGVTTPCANRARELLEILGYEVIAFHCNGIGAQAMEELADNGKLVGIFDLSPHDITDFLFGGIMPAMPNRLQATCRKGVPQVIAPGCADIVLYGPVENIPSEILERKHVIHNPIHTHVKATYEQMLELGRFISGRVSQSKGYATVLVPQQGFSQLNRAGGPIYEPESDRGFLEGLKEGFQQAPSPKATIKVLDMHINDPEFADAAVDELHGLIQKS